jgi:hypothetical protein
LSVVVEHANSFLMCLCGNNFKPDSVFCRKCGRPRPEDVVTNKFHKIAKKVATVVQATLAFGEAVGQAHARKPVINGAASAATEERPTNPLLLAARLAKARNSSAASGAAADKPEVANPRGAGVGEAAAVGSNGNSRNSSRSSSAARSSGASGSNTNNNNGSSSSSDASGGKVLLGFKAAMAAKAMAVAAAAASAAAKSESDAADAKPAKKKPWQPKPPPPGAAKPMAFGLSGPNALSVPKPPLPELADSTAVFTGEKVAASEASLESVSEARAARDDHAEEAEVPAALVKASKSEALDTEASGFGSRFSQSQSHRSGRSLWQMARDKVQDAAVVKVVSKAAPTVSLGPCATPVKGHLSYLGLCR